MTEDQRVGRSEGTGRGDEDLRAEFQTLRRQVESAGKVPDFAEMMDGARVDGRVEQTRAAKRRLAFPGARIWLPVAAAAVAAVLLVGRPGSDADAAFDRAVSDYSRTASSGAFRSPTEALMDIPGVDLGAVPSFGGSWDPEEPDGTVGSEGRDS